MGLVIRDDIEQRSQPWYEARLGLVTASNFQCLMATKTEERKGRTSLLRKLAAEIITGEAAPDYDNADLRRGREQEDDARRAYELVTDAEVRRVGIGISDEHGGCGASPDGLIGDDGGLELKSMRPDLLIGVLSKGEVPSEHVAQVQGNMMVFGRAWWSICIFAPRMPLFIRRVHRDAEYCARLAKEIAAFNAEKADLVDWVRRYGR
jgi:YqaJ-like viral recombinase domain